MSDGLRVDDLVVLYGGHTAVDHVSLHAPPGGISGLIGPNGAGKTTTFNACSGLLKPAAGRITFGGADVTRLGPAARARRGLGRTFQQTELVDGSTVVGNVSLGREASLAGANPVRHLRASGRERNDVAERTAAALDRCGITHLAERPASTLSTGQRRLAELARVVAGGFHILLLDEPSAGLDRAETQTFGSVLRALVEELGIGILLVEHDIGLVMRVCDRIAVLDFGKLIFEGTPDEVRASDLVRSAYLGKEIA